MKYVVYCLQNKLNNKIYIGKTNDFLKRLSKHKSISKKGPESGKNEYNVLHSAIAKYGFENFLAQVLEEFDDEADCLEAEKFWIEFFRSNINRFGNDFGYNLTSGGDGISGYHHLDSFKIKMREIKTGTTLSLETKAKIGKSNQKPKSNKKYPLSKESVMLIKQDARSLAKIAKDFNVSKTVVFNIKHNKTHKQ